MWTIFVLILLALLLGSLVFLTRKRAESKIDLIKAILMVGMIFAGGLSNKVVVAVNGDKMPVSLTAMKMAPFCSVEKRAEKIAELKNNRDSKHCLMTEKTKLRFLTDIIPLPGRVCSAGDILLLSGYILLGVWFCKRKEEIVGWVFLLYGILGFIF